MHAGWEGEAGVCSSVVCMLSSALAITLMGHWLLNIDRHWGLWGEGGFYLQVVPVVLMKASPEGK